MNSSSNQHSWTAARLAGAVVLVAAIHLIVWSSAFRVVYKAIDSGASIPASLELVLGLVLNILGAPLMYLLYLPSLSGGTSSARWGDDLRLVIWLAGLNSLLWGCLVVWGYRFLHRKRTVHLVVAN